MKEEITIREKIALRFVLFCIELVKPYEYNHKFKEYYAENMNNEITKYDIIKIQTY